MVRLLLVLGWALLSLRAVLGQEGTCSDQSFFALPDKVKFIFNSNKWYIGSEARYCVHMVQASQILTDVIDASDKLGFVCFSSVNGCMKMRFKVYPGFRLREVSGTMGTNGKKVGSISHSKKERAGQPAVKSLFFCPETILSGKLCCKTKMFMSPEMHVVEEETGAHLTALPWAKKCKLRSESGSRGPNRPVCDGVRMTCQIANRIYGTEGSDVIYGTEETDVIFGRGGSDEIHGLGGRDYIYGGSGDDMLFGGDNKDTLRGEEGYDTLYGENGGDTLLGGYQDDLLFGGKGDDFLNGEEDYDRSFGEVGDDTIVSFNERSGGLPPDAYSSDYISGGDGDDGLFPDSRSSANGGEGNDLMVGGLGNDLMVGGFHKVGGGGNDTMLGGYFNSGGDGDDYIKSFYDDVGYSDRGAVIQGGDGNDDLYIGGAGPQSVSGGEGDDRIRMSSFAQYSNQIIDAGPGDDNVTALSRSSYYDQLEVNLGEGDDSLEAINFFYLDLNGNDGKDYFHVSGTKFYYDIDPSKKVVEIYGDGDDDIVKVFDTKATIFGGDGDDEIVAYYGGTIFGEGGSDDVRGRSDQDHEVLAGEGDDVVTLDGGNNTVAGESGNDVLRTGDGDDNITGGEGNDILESGGGSDTVDGGPGMNIIDGVPDY